MQKKPSRLNALSLILTLVITPAVVLISNSLIKSKSYYVAAVLMIVCAIIPFFVYFENRKTRTSEIVILAIMTALAVAARSIMMFLPQMKPTAAVIIVTAMAFGPNCGFLSGVLSMFLSNFIFGQGMFTPFQMLGMGLVGFFSGLIFYKRKKLCNKYAVSITGGLLTFLVYGICVDTCSVLMLSGSFTLNSIISIFLSGISFNVIHGITTALILFFITAPMNEKFSRLRIKYGIFG